MKNKYVVLLLLLMFLISSCSQKTSQLSTFEIESKFPGTWRGHDRQSLVIKFGQNKKFKLRRQDKNRFAELEGKYEIFKNGLVMIHLKKGNNSTGKKVYGNSIDKLEIIQLTNSKLVAIYHSNDLNKKMKLNLSKQ